MHRFTPASAAMRAYTSGGMRTLIKSIEDGTLMQSMTGQGMKGEGFSGGGSGDSKGPEAPQNYGFTSVVAKAKEAGGMIQQCAEGFMSFMGGGRSHPVMTMMDDRRHRLKNLIKDAAEGSVGMFGLKEWGQQFLNTDKGMYMTGNTEKMLRFALVENQNGQTQQAGGGSSGGGGGAAAAAIAAAIERGYEITNQDGTAIYEPIKFQTGSGVEFEIEVLPPEVSTRDSGGGGGGNGSGGAGSSSNSRPTGQKTLHKQDSKIYKQFDNKAIFTKHNDGYANITPDISQTYHKQNNHDTRCDSNHVHIGWEDQNKIWVNKDGCFSSKPIMIRNCDDQNSSNGSSGPPATSGPPAYSASDPLSLDNNGNMSMAAQAPLAVSSAVELRRDIEHPVPDIGPKTVQPLILQFKAPLFMDTDGFLTSTGGGVGGVPEAPTDGMMYGRQSVAGTPGWYRALAITGDVLDGGSF